MGETRMVDTPQKTTQEVADEFHMMIGYCIAEWARVEDELFRVCHAVLRCPKEQAAIVYYRSPQLRTRLELTDELVRAVLPKHKSGNQPHDDLKFWTDDVLKKINDLLPIRNRIGSSFGRNSPRGPLHGCQPFRRAVRIVV
jgi:hypothetical protein